ncbi:hypothetical protein KC324_g20202, partial [Hortaea werneckii]
MQLTSATIFVAGLAAQQAAATGWSVGAKHYSNPFNTNNECSSHQSGGYDWNGLEKGSFSSYGSNDFSGFTCTDSPGKRDTLSKRTFQSKCISGNLDEHPKMACSGNDNMSPETYHVSSSHDADVDCEYEMPDGSVCKQTHSCSRDGSIIQNSQCGGAKSVTFKPGKNAPSGCSLGIHSIGFNCGSASSSVPVSSATSSYPVSSSSMVLTSSVPLATSSSSATTPEAYTSSSSVESSQVLSSSSSVPEESTSSSSIETSPVMSTSSSVSLPQYNITSMTGSVPVGTAPAYSESSSEAGPLTSSSVPVGTAPTYSLSSSVPVGTAPSSSKLSSVPIGTAPAYSKSSSEASPQSSSAPVSSYTTSTVYSTSVATITSCGPTVTNCPADSTTE